jgi:hypothetical protein
MRKNILEQAQNECWSRNQQLMTELTEFLRVFQTISSDIHAIAQCSQKVSFPHPFFLIYIQGLACTKAQHTLL